MIHPNSTLREIALNVPAAIPVFEKYHFDFSCRGNRTLKDACQARNLSPDQIEKELQAKMKKEAESSRGFLEMGLESLMDHILEKHHTYVREKLPLLFEHSQALARDQGAKHPELLEVAALIENLTFEVHQHMAKEEEVLFPLIRQMLYSKKYREKKLENPTPMGLNSPIEVMEFEHENAGRALDRIRNLTHHYQAPGGSSPNLKRLFSELGDFELDLHQHIHLENNLLFPRARDLENELSSLC